MKRETNSEATKTSDRLRYGITMGWGLEHLASYLGKSAETTRVLCYYYGMKPPRKADTHQTSAEQECCAFLERCGFTVFPSPYGSPWDATVSGLRFEFKSSNYFAKRNGWFLNIQRRGLVDETEVDYYVFRLAGGPLKKPVFVIKKAPIGKPYIRINHVPATIRAWVAESISPERIKNEHAITK